MPQPTTHMQSTLPTNNRNTEQRKKPKGKHRAEEDKQGKQTKERSLSRKTKQKSSNNSECWSLQRWEHTAPFVQQSHKASPKPEHFLWCCYLLAICRCQSFWTKLPQNAKEQPGKMLHVTDAPSVFLVRQAGETSSTMQFVLIHLLHFLGKANIVDQARE